MTGWIILAIVLLFVLLCFHVALREVLLQTSDGEIERELARNGRLERTRWMIGRQLDLATVVQWKSTAIQCAIVAMQEKNTEQEIAAAIRQSFEVKFPAT